MATKSKTNQPAPKSNQKAKGKAKPSATVAPASPVNATPTNMFDNYSAVKSAGIVEKQQAMQGARQKLAQACDLYSEGEAKQSEANIIANEAGVMLYQGMAEGNIVYAEVSAALGDAFGYKEKKDGTPSKTPKGQGEAIRKRVARLNAAREYVTDGTPHKFFEGLPTDDIAIIINNVGLLPADTSIFTAYERLAEIKKEHTETLHIAFDPKKIEAIADALASDGACDKLEASSDLMAAYAQLNGVLGVVGAELQQRNDALEAETTPPSGETVDTPATVD